MTQPTPEPVVSPLALTILQALIGAIPSLATWISKGIEGDDSPVAEQVRAILPEDGASEAARKLLESRGVT